ncbi:uncharacterized protein LOC126908060 [Daktulosphaira vitifoliae]|uniref:uncharacterized protein LOC126908060 n=1 Tax=Daktulosphaira vitifoliae TaxID=58002 RepID=UPI0021A9C36D|nr:uncharacterized protein LOC126908060 [Daktulosphaira vitifoliae]
MSHRKKKHLKSNENVYKSYKPQPTLYSSVIQTESKIKQLSIKNDNSKLKLTASQVGLKSVNFPLNEEVYDYSNLVDIGLHSNLNQLPRQTIRKVNIEKTLEPKLSDYYQPCFNNIEQIRLNEVQPNRELTVQFDGLAITREANKINNLIFQ